MSVQIQIVSSNIRISDIVFANNKSCNGVIDGSSNVSFSSFRYNILNNRNKHFVQQHVIETEIGYHTSSLVNDKIYIIGGSIGLNTYTNKVLVYDISNNSWSTDSTNGIERLAHSAIYYQPTQRIYLFGGFGGTSTYYNDTMYYDIGLKTLTTISPTTKPDARRGHAYTLGGDDDKMYIIGGLGGSSTYYNDTWYFDILNEEWIGVTTSGTPPSVRTNSTCIYYRGDGGDGSEKKIYLFGGFGGSTTYYNDVHILDLSTDSNGSWSNVTTSGSSPNVMSGHTMNYLTGSDCFLVFGGFSFIGSVAYYNDIWKFNMRTNTWIKDYYNTVSDPSGIYLHTSELYNDTTTNRYQLFVFGGRTKTGLQNKTWSCDFANVLADPLKISDLSGQEFY